jgi:hypothetical protein
MLLYGHGDENQGAEDDGHEERKMAIEIDIARADLPDVDDEVSDEQYFQKCVDDGEADFISFH